MARRYRSVLWYLEAPLLIILHQLTELLRPAKHCQRIARMKWARICRMHFRLVVVPKQDDVEMIIVLHIADSFISKARGSQNGHTRQAELLAFDGDRIRDICSRGRGGEDRRGHFCGTQCGEPELFLQGVREVFIEDTDDNLDLRVEGTRFERDLQVHRVLLAGENDRFRVLDICAFERTRVPGICLDDGDAHLARRVGGVCAKLNLDHHDAFTHLMQSLRNAIAQMPQADQYDMFVHCRGDSHLPLLAPCPPVEKQTAKVGQSLCEDDHPDNGHEEMKYLQTEVFREISNGLQERGGENNVNRLTQTLNWFADQVRDCGVREPAPEHRNRE